MSKRGKNKKFKDLDIYSLQQIENKENFKNSKIKNGKEYKTPLQTLKSEYAGLDEDIVEILYEENNNNYQLTKKKLDQMNIDFKVIECENEKNKTEDKADSKNIAPSEKDINMLIQLNYDDSSDLDFPKTNKTLDQYDLYFNINELKSFEGLIEENCIEFYLSVLEELFPSKDREELLQVIFDKNFDIDNVIIYFIDELEEKSNKEEIEKNFSIENSLKDINYNLLNTNNLQEDLLKVVKLDEAKENLKSKIYNEENFPYLDQSHKSSNIENQRDDEFFLNKPINSIHNKKIKDNLKKLLKKYPLLDEFQIKWIYYQLMNYKLTVEYIDKNNDIIKVSKIQELFTNCSLSENIKEDKLDKDKESNHYTQKYLTNILNSNTDNFSIKNNLSLNEYNSIRKQLYNLASNCWRNGNYKEGRLIIDKAKMYNTHIINLIKNKETKILKDLNLRSNVIDLHGLRVKECKILIKKKLHNLKNSLQNGDNDWKNNYINIITGVGHHSKNGAVLLPRLSEWLHNQSEGKKDEVNLKIKIKFKVDNYRGLIKIFII